MIASFFKEKYILLNDRIISTPRYSYMLIALILVVGNWYSVFGVKALLLDDMVRYYMVGHGQFPDYISVRAFFLPYTEWFFWKLLYISPVLARGFYVIFVIIPLSIVFYHFFTKHLKLSKSISLGAAILPNIIPAQTYVPSFVNGSYHMYGLLFSMLMIMLCLNFIKSNKLNFLYSIIPFVIFASPQIMTQSLFLYPAFSILIIFSDGKLPRKLTILFSLLITFIFKYFWVKRHPFSDVSKPVELDTEQILYRLNHFIENTTVANVDISFLFLIILFLAIVSCVYYTKNPNILFSSKLPFSRYSGAANVLLLYSFLSAWIIGTSYVFITQSKYFPSRYLHISAFGINCLLMLLVFYLLSKIKAKLIFKEIVLILILFSLISRSYNIDKTFSASNRHYQFFKSALCKNDFPENSQIFIDRSSYGTGGYWMWGSGYLQYITGRHDITGHFYKELSYYNAFEKNRSYSRETLARGFDLKKPFFAYRVDVKTQSLRPIHYILQWLSDSIESEWILYKQNNGLLQKISSGDGIDDYISYLSDTKQHNISKGDILWGGCPSEEAIHRLELSPEIIDRLCE